MNWFTRTLLRKFHGTREADATAIDKSQAITAEIDRTDPHVDAEHLVALDKLRQAEQRSRRLKAMDAQNHYSESLTLSFRGIQ